MLNAPITRRDCLKGLGALALSFMHEADARARGTAEPHLLTALQLSAGLRAGKWSARDLVRLHLDRIHQLNGPFEHFDANGAINAFIRVFPDQAYQQAERADLLGEYPGWTSIPVALKDVFDVAGQPVTVGTPAFASYRPSQDCTLWTRWREQGAVLLGHTQAQRFITGLTTPQTANPWNRELIVGGSSGGSAAAVAAGMVPIALGTETTGSLIYPAACCGVTTLKPSHGLLSLAGVYPGLPSFDVAGPIARSAADCTWLMATLAGIDPADPYTAQQRGHEIDWASNEALARKASKPLAGLRLLVATNERYSDPTTRTGPNDPGPEVSVDRRIQQCFEEFLRSLRDLGAHLVHANIPSELGRFGRFRVERLSQLGNRSAQEFLAAADVIHEGIPAQYLRLQAASEDQWRQAITWFGGDREHLGSEQVRSLAPLMTPTALNIAADARDELRSAWQQLLAQHRCDAHVYLEIGSPVPKRRGLEDTHPPHACRNGVVPNDLGWPALGLPIARASGLEVPVSAQIMARRWHDHRLLAWGEIWQRAHPASSAMTPVIGTLRAIISTLNGFSCSSY